MAVAQTSRVSLVLDERGATLDARDATLREVLSEWERVGGMKLLNAEVLDERRVTLQVSAVGEREALDILLRDLGGYVLGVRGANASGRSQFGTLVLAPNKGPVTRPASPALAPRPAFTPQTLIREADDTALALPAPVDASPTPPDPEGFGLPRASGLAAGAGAAPFGSQAEADEELVEGARASTLVPKELRPPTPLYVAPPASDSSRPFGAAGAATPGTIMMPVPGAFAPTVDPRQPARTQP